jgi:DNA invertase Pin-like site-specific DNA recombinase
MGIRIGYGRVSSKSQNLDSQYDLLKQAGCEKLFAETMTGTKDSRPGWDNLMEYVRPGDTIVVVELSRMTRSLAHLLQLAKEFREKEINLVSLREAIDTSTATGRAFLGFMGVMIELELDLKAERAAAGRESAKARGRSGGRPRTDQKLLEKARILYESSDFSVTDVCKTVGVGKRTFFRHLEEYRQAEYQAKLESGDVRIGDQEPDDSDRFANVEF